jgi:hypothetical protein
VALWKDAGSSRARLPNDSSIAALHWRHSRVVVAARKMPHAVAYVPVALSFLALIVCLIFYRSPVPIDRAEVEEKSLRLLHSWLSPEQAQQWDALSEFEVVGSHTETRYRIRRGKVMNVHELDRAGNIVAHWCFAPRGDLPIGDVLLAQKIAIETMEREALKMARRNHVHVADAQLH